MVDVLRGQLKGQRIEWEEDVQTLQNMLHTDRNIHAEELQRAATDKANLETALHERGLQCDAMAREVCP